MSRSLPVSLPLLAIAIGALLPAGAHARPSYDLDAPCYSEGDTMVFSGGGYTPDGEVNLLFSANGRIGGTYGTRADASGAIGGRLNVPDMDRFMDSSEDTTEVFSSANDRTRLDVDGPSENGAGFTTFQFARFGFRLRTPGDRDVTPRRSVTVEPNRLERFSASVVAVMRSTPFAAARASSSRPSRPPTPRPCHASATTNANSAVAGSSASMA